MMGLVMDRIPDMSLPLRWGYDILVVSDRSSIVGHCATGNEVHAVVRMTASATRFPVVPSGTCGRVCSG